MTRLTLGSLALAAAMLPWQPVATSPGFADRTGPYLGEKPPGLTPQLFADGLVSTGGFERDIAITPDGREIYFGLSGPSYQYTSVAVTRLVDGRWTEPELVPGLDDSRYLNLEAALAPDGNTLYFLSTRPDAAAGAAAGNQDIWVLTRTPTGWSAPRNLGSPVNSALPEYFPSVTRDGTIYFTREEAGTRISAIWRARRDGDHYLEPEKLPAQVNSGRSHYNAFIAPDESYLIVPIDGRTDSLGGCDYYVVFRTPDDRWSDPVNLGPAINTKGSQEFSPYVSPDGKYFFFMSSRSDRPERLTYTLFRTLHDRPANGNADIYWVDASVVTSLRAQAFPDSPDAINAAARAGDVAKIRNLLDAQPRLVEARDGTGRTPLHVAAAADQSAIVSLLMEKGAAIDARTGGGETPLAVAASGGAARSAASLIDAGAAVDAANTYGRTPLLLVARESGKVEIARALLDRKANIDAADKFGDTPLTLAVWRGFKDVVDLLLERGAAVPTSGQAAKRLAESSASAGLDTLFARLASAGVDLTGQADRGGTILHQAASGGSTAIVAELLRRKLGVNDADRDGWTPLHNAAYMGRLDVVKTLADAGADLQARTVLGQTAWNLASESHLDEVAHWLAANGAGRDAPRFPALSGAYLGQTPPGRTPAEFAVGIVGGHFSVHSSVTFSPDGREAYWSESIPPRGAGYGSGRTMMSTRVGDRWTYPVRAMVGNVPLEDVPAISADGRRIYDMARRPMPGQTASGKENIWVADRIGDRWGTPRPLDPAVNALPHHWQFAVGRDGTVYFSSSWKGARGLFMSRPKDGRYGEPVPLGAPVSAGNEGMPFLAADESYLLFQRNYDIYVTFRGPDGTWTDPVALPAAVNTRDMELCPTVSPDGRYLFFIRAGRVFWVDAAIIHAQRPAARQ